jgi:hypothetical protein
MKVNGSEFIKIAELTKQYDRRSKAGLRGHCVPTGRDTPPSPRLVPRDAFTCADARTPRPPLASDAPPP